MVVTYTTANKVGELLGFPSGYFTGSTTPTTTVIENFINRAEDQIDFSTGHAWRTTTVTDEYIDPISKYQYGTGIAFKLSNRSILGISTLNIWDGSSWVDWIATKTEGRGDDYWIDATNGFLYLVSLSQIYPRGVYCTYTFGEATVPSSIENAATKLAALDILTSPEFSTVVFTESGQNYTQHDGRISKWQKDAENIMFRHSEFKSM